MTEPVSFVGASRSPDALRVLGIDPGLQRMGWGVVDVCGSRLQHVANGVVASGQGELPARLAVLFRALEAIIAAQRPDQVAVEQTFVNRDAAGTLKLGQARAVGLLVPALAGLPVAEYAPNQIKKAVVGVGHAEKQQVEHMVRMMLPGVVLAGTDAADALAIAICHAFQAGAQARLRSKLSGAG